MFKKIIRSKVTLIATAVIVVAFGSIVYIALSPSSNEDLKSYEFREKMNIAKPGEAMCDARNPACGFCYGEVINGYCYWNSEDERS